MKENRILKELGYILPYIQDLANAGILGKNATYDNGELLSHVINYIIRIGEVSNKVVFQELLHKVLEEEPRRKIMTIFEQYQLEAKQQYIEGKLEGKLEGEYKAKVKTLKKLLALNFSLDMITEITGLNKKQIAEIQAEWDMLEVDGSIH